MLVKQDLLFLTQSIHNEMKYGFLTVQLNIIINLIIIYIQSNQVVQSAEHNKQTMKTNKQWSMSTLNNIINYTIIYITYNNIRLKTKRKDLV